MTARTAARRHRRLCPIASGAGGLVSADWCAVDFEDVLRNLGPRLALASKIKRLTIHSSEYRGKRIQIVFTPFDLVRPNAKVILVGITPGRQQWELAVDATRGALRSGATLDDALLAASRAGGFAGPMRRNLVMMLDGIGVQRALGLRTAGDMFEGDSDLIDGTSAILHAVFVDGQNYAGHQPPIARVPILREFVERVLSANLIMAPNALIVPLGKAAESAVDLAAACARIDTKRVLRGLPHPSGANGGRAQQFAAARPKLMREVRLWRRDVLNT